MAARYGNVDVVSYLCTIQADPNLADRVSVPVGADTSVKSLLPEPSCLQEQEIPLHCAAWHGYSAVARALCQAGCDVNATNREGESPLLTASARGFVDIVECLVEHRADLQATDKVFTLSMLQCFPNRCTEAALSSVSGASISCFRC